jgi:hypothetical protein
VVHLGWKCGHLDRQERQEKYRNLGVTDESSIISDDSGWWATDVIGKLQAGWPRERLNELLPDA